MVENLVTYRKAVASSFKFSNSAWGLFSFLCAHFDLTHLTRRGGKICPCTLTQEVILTSMGLCVYFKKTAVWRDFAIFTFLKKIFSEKLFTKFRYNLWGICIFHNNLLRRHKDADILKNQPGPCKDQPFW